jgi:hypothetical protein
VAVAVLGALVLLALLLTFVAQEVQALQLQLPVPKRTTQVAAAGELILAVKAASAAGVRGVVVVGLRVLQVLRIQEVALAVVQVLMARVRPVVQA